MQHRTTKAEDGSLAGVWWEEGADKPYCDWIYNRETRELHVRRGPYGHVKYLPHEGPPVTDDKNLVVKLSEIALDEAKGLAS
jgi:hypothetical protein